MRATGRKDLKSPVAVPICPRSFLIALCLHDVVANRIPNERSRGWQVELTHNRRSVRFHRLQAYCQFDGDLLVGIALRYQLHDGAFPLGERRTDALGPPAMRIEKNLGDGFRKERPVHG